MALEPDPLDLEAEDERTREKAQKDAAARAREADDWKWQMDTPRGRRIVWSLLEQAGLFVTKFSPESNSMNSFHLGRRDLGLAMLNAVLAHAPDQFVIMQKEAQE